MKNGIVASLWADKKCDGKLNIVFEVVLADLVD